MTHEQLVKIADCQLATKVFQETLAAHGLKVETVVVETRSGEKASISIHVYAELPEGEA